MVIVSVSDQLIIGRRPDHRGPLIARALASLGIRPVQLTTAASDSAELTEFLEMSSSRSDIVVVSGGLGPAPFQTAALEAAMALASPAEGESSSSELPSGARELEGTKENDSSSRAFTMKLGESELFFLPSSSPALDAAIELHLLPHLSARRTGRVVATHTIRAFGPSESDIEAHLADIERGSPGNEIELYRDGPEIVLVLSAWAESLETASSRVHHLGAAVCTKLGHDVHGPLGQDLPQAVSEALRARGWTLATVEVGTGGLIPERFALDEERSSFFALGLTLEDLNGRADGKEIFAKPLGNVGRCRGGEGGEKPDVLSSARGIKESSGADVGLALVGLLGPRGGSAETPTGLIHFAVTGGGSEHIHEERFRSVPRRHIGQWIAARALRLLLDHCREKGGGPSSAPSSPST